MNIFFSASIRGGLQNQEVYFDIIRHLEWHGRVLTEHTHGTILIGFLGMKHCPLVKCTNPC